VPSMSCPGGDREQSSSVQYPRSLLELARDGKIVNDAFELFSYPTLECFGIDFDFGLGAQRAITQTSLECSLDGFAIHDTGNLNHRNPLRQGAIVPADVEAVL
jgi:hypothetical protein